MGNNSKDSDGWVSIKGRNGLSGRWHPETKELQIRQDLSGWRSVGSAKTEEVAKKMFSNCLSA